MVVSSLSNLNLEQTIKEYNRIAERLGLVATPLTDLSGLSCNPHVRIFAKDESQNITGSVKARAALFNLVMTFDLPLASRRYLDASSGNYAKALAYFTAELGYSCTLFVPESFATSIKEYITKERLCCNIFFEGIKNSDEARDMASQFASQHPELHYLDQYNNDGSWLCHYHFTAEEIIQELNALDLTPAYFISGIGSGGTLIGAGKKLKERFDTRIIGLESAVPHTIRGIRRLDAKHTPSVYSNQKSIVNCLQSVDIAEVQEFKDCYHLGYGISACANILAAVKLSQRLQDGVIATVIPDRVC